MIRDTRTRMFATALDCLSAQASEIVLCLHTEPGTPERARALEESGANDIEDLVPMIDEAIYEAIRQRNAYNELRGYHFDEIVVNLKPRP